MKAPRFSIATANNAIWLVAIVGLSLSLAALWLIQLQLAAHKQLDFEWVSHNRIRAISHGIDTGLLAVDTARYFLNAVDQVEAPEFRRFAKSLLARHPEIESLLWVPQPVDPEYPNTESVSGLSVLIVSRNDSGERFDLTETPQFTQMLKEMAKRSELTSSGRIDFSSQQDGSEFGFMAGMPVINQKEQELSEEKRSPEGYVVGLFRVSDLVDASISLLQPRGVEILLLDETLDHDEKFIYFYASRLLPKSVSSGNYREWLTRDVEPKVSEPMEVAGRKWRIICGQTDQFYTAEAFQEGPWVALGAGLLFTVLISFYLVRVNENESERMLMQQRLVEREELFRQMTENVDEVFWAISADTGQLLYLSPACKRIFGYYSESSDRRLIEILKGAPEEDRIKLIKALEQVPQDGAAMEVVHRIRRVDDTTRWVRTQCFPVDNGAGKITKIVGSIEDITEKKLADEALRESEAKLRNMFQQSPDIIMTIDKRGKILLMNRSIPELPAEKAVGRNSLALMPYGFRKWFRRRLKKVFKKGVTRKFDYSADDGTFWEGRIVPIKGDGPVTAAMVIATDVTEKRNLEIQALYNARLASIGVLAAGVAHEINNPNNAIQFNASLVSRAWQDVTPVLEEYYQENGDFILGGLSFEEARERFPLLLGEIGRNSDRIKRIVENLKHMSRQDAGRLNGDVDIQQVLESTMMILHNQIQRCSDHCTLEAPENLPAARGNSQQLEQVFINVLLNALQSLPSRERRVDIIAGYNPEDAMIEVVIKDQGCGIPERDLSRVTEPFFSSRTEVGGTGLGLSISHSIIERHKGRMRFKSQPGQGTSVTISVPAARPG